MRRFLKYFSITFAVQFLLGVVIVFLGFTKVLPEKVIFDYYFVIYEPFLLLFTGVGFMAVFVLLPLAMAVYSGLFSLIVCVITRKQ